MRGHLGYLTAGTAGGEDAGWTSSWLAIGCLQVSWAPQPSGCPLENLNPRMTLRPRTRAGQVGLPEQTGNQASPSPLSSTTMDPGHFKWPIDEGIKETHMHFQALSWADLTLGDKSHQVPRCLADETQSSCPGAAPLPASCKVTDLSGPLTPVNEMLNLFPALGPLQTERGNLHSTP